MSLELGDGSQRHGAERRCHVSQNPFLDFPTVTSPARRALCVNNKVPDRVSPGALRPA